ncbi:hypothetical protein ABIC45_003475 [Mucilaginibacter rubeus]|uniref:Eco57I restriction-modification methylase domain-containing protein n=1 Tax=Mucilaginibacter rubeus TaxID=2027860 RepID=UPI003398FD44
MNKTELKKILESEYKSDKWIDVLRYVFGIEDIYTKPQQISDIDPEGNKPTVFLLGHFGVEDYLVGIYQVDVTGLKSVRRSKVGLLNLLDPEKKNIDAALIVFIENEIWRFSYVSDLTVRIPGTSTKTRVTTDPRRYTYLLGKGEKAKTATDKLLQIASFRHDGTLSLKVIKDAFSVEKLSDDFFLEYKYKHYADLVEIITGERVVKREKKDDWIKTADPSPYFLRTFKPGRDDEAAKIEARNFVKRFLGRIVFLYFVQKKGWLGASSLDYQDGDPNFMFNLFRQAGDIKTFYDDWLEKLFFDTLNKNTDERKDENFQLPNGEIKKIPFLNGGLFEEKTEYKQKNLLLEPEIFHHAVSSETPYQRGIFDFLNAYNFTIYEDSPEEHTMAVDPEMLGHIFENLLEDNKDKGAFYTPKEIVHYMCQKSLIEYLCTQCHAEDNEELRDGLEQFIKNQHLGGIAEYEEPILKALRDVKICDPAIGSGAFPMGILLEIFHAVETLGFANKDTTIRIWELDGEWSPAKVKLGIIENSIYGVDIEPGAVDIARLRFWLSLVVDELKPQPLPNLDYKIVVGNSLLCKLEDIIIDIDWSIEEGTQTDVFGNENLFKRIELLRTISDKQKEYFQSPGVNKKKLGLEIRNLKIDIIINQLELMINTKGLRSKPNENGRKNIVQLTERYIHTQNWINSISRLNKIKRQDELPLNFFDWKLDFPEILNPMFKQNGHLPSSTGFDIIIGNPPYVDSENMINKDPEFRESLKNKYLTAKGNWDLFVPFVEQGVSLISENGIFCYIIPNKILSASYTTELRHHLAHFNILEIRDYSALNIFKTANVYPITLMLEKSSQKSDVIMTSMKSKEIVQASNQINPSIFFRDIFWDKFFFSDDYVKLLIKVSSGFELGSIENFNISGAATVNEAYLIKEKIFEDIGQRGVKKLVNTGTIDKWTSLWGIKKTQYIKNAYEFPVISNSDIDKINATRLYQSNSPKLIIAGMSNEIEAFLDVSGDYIAGKSTTIILDTLDNLKVFAAILNSDVASFYVKFNYHSLKMSGGYLNINSDIIRSIPIPILSSQTRMTVIEIVDNLLLAKQKEETIYLLEQQINAIVYKSYGFSYDEIKLINSQFSLTKKEYFEIEI